MGDRPHRLIEEGKARAAAVSAAALAFALIRLQRRQQDLRPRRLAIGPPVQPATPDLDLTVIDDDAAIAVAPTLEAVHDQLFQIVVVGVPSRRAVEDEMDPYRPVVRLTRVRLREDATKLLLSFARPLRCVVMTTAGAGAALGYRVTRNGDIQKNHIDSSTPDA